MKRVLVLGFVLMSFLGTRTSYARELNEPYEGPDHELDRAVDALDTAHDIIDVETLQHHLLAANLTTWEALSKFKIKLMEIGNDVSALEKIRHMPKRLRMARQYALLCEERKSVLEEETKEIFSSIAKERKSFGDFTTSGMFRDSVENTVAKIYGRFVDACERQSYGTHRSAADFVSAQITELRKAASDLGSAYPWAITNDLDLKAKERLETLRAERLKQQALKKRAMKSQ